MEDARVCVRTQIEGRDGCVFIEGTVIDINSATKQFTVQIVTSETGAPIVSGYKILKIMASFSCPLVIVIFFYS